MNRARALGATIAVLVFAIDQAAKFLIVHGFAGVGEAPTSLGPFLDLNLRFNPGISFSFFPQATALGVSVLLGLTLVAVALLGVWLWRTHNLLIGAGIGAIIGGALGNALDRLSYGAVVDFLDLHLFGRHFFVFNLADAAINVGVALLILESLLARRAATV